MEAVIGFPIRGWPIERMLEAARSDNPVKIVLSAKETVREMGELLAVMEARAK